MYDPATREAKVVLKGLYYANGVALSKEGDYVMVVETNRIRVGPSYDAGGPRVAPSWRGR